jgi:hypothetical protein
MSAIQDASVPVTEMTRAAARRRTALREGDGTGDSWTVDGAFGAARGAPRAGQLQVVGATALL